MLGLTARQFTLLSPLFVDDVRQRLADVTRPRISYQELRQQAMLYPDQQPYLFEGEIGQETFTIARAQRPPRLIQVGSMQIPQRRRESGFQPPPPMHGRMTPVPEGTSITVRIPNPLILFLGIVLIVFLVVALLALFFGLQVKGVLVLPFILVPGGILMFLTIFTFVSYLALAIEATRTRQILSELFQVYTTALSGAPQIPSGME